MKLLRIDTSTKYKISMFCLHWSVVKMSKVQLYYCYSILRKTLSNLWSWTLFCICMHICNQCAYLEESQNKLGGTFWERANTESSDVSL